MSLPPQPPPPPSARKRKREEELGPSILIGAHAASPFDNPVRITPTVILPRSYFPLQWLAGVPARLYYCSNHMLALSEPGKVAVVKMEGERQLSAIESLEDNAYVLYKLSTQVRLKDVRKLHAQLSRLRMFVEPGGCAAHEEEWWEKMGSMTYPFSEHPLMPPPALKTEAGKSASVGVIDQEIPANELGNMDDKANHIFPGYLHGTRQSPAEVLENLRNQYYETLYLAKTSLAYFSKSALSRARAFYLDDDSEPPARLGELATFLHSMLVPLRNMDSKHRKTLPIFACEERVDDMTVLKQGEETYLYSWRASTFGDRFLAINDARLKGVLEKLKTRETELQVIILLEILSLEKLNPTTAPHQKSKSDNKRKGKKKKNTRENASKATDPVTHLELLVDRLCIWHSIGPDAILKEDEPPLSDTVPEKDYLRNFSMEVIMPFYASKLPEKCASINKKFGIRQANCNRGVRPRPSKPGGSPKKDDAGSPAKGRISKLSRSTATPAGSALISETSLSALVAESQSSKTSRGGNLNSKNLAKRVIQFEKVDIKKTNEELEEAINALRKPNRMTVAGEFVDTIEERLSKVKKPPKKPMIRSSSGASVLVSATPRKQKQRDAMMQQEKAQYGQRLDDSASNTSLSITATPKKRQHNTTMEQENSGFISSTPTVVNMTPNVNMTPKRSYSDFATNTPSTSFTSVIPETTPKRRRETSVIRRLNESKMSVVPEVLVETPIVMKPRGLRPTPSAVFETPVKGSQTPGHDSPMGGVALMGGTPATRMITPLPIASMMGVELTSEKEGGREGGRRDKMGDDDVHDDIYEALGWGLSDDF